MPTPDEKLPPLTFAHLLLIALEETKVSRTEMTDDAVREAAEELAVDPRTLRPILSRLFAALVRYEIPARAAAEMVVARMKR
jgi:hypothetical protein